MAKAAKQVRQRKKDRGSRRNFSDSKGISKENLSALALISKAAQRDQAARRGFTAALSAVLLAMGLGSATSDYVTTAQPASFVPQFGMPPRAKRRWKNSLKNQSLNRQRKSPVVTLIDKYLPPRAMRPSTGGIAESQDSPTPLPVSQGIRYKGKFFRTTNKKK